MRTGYGFRFSIIDITHLDRDETRYTIAMDVKEVPLTRIKELQSMSYEEYLQSPEWEEKRERILLLRGRVCQLCGKSNDVLHVHHNNYQHRGEELDSDLIVLCKGCHERFHGIEKLEEVEHHEQESRGDQGSGVEGSR